MLPVEGMTLEFMMEVIDGVIDFELPGDVLRLAVTDLFDLPEVLHVHLISHFFVDGIGGSGVYH